MPSSNFSVPWLIAIYGKWRFCKSSIWKKNSFKIYIFVYLVLFSMQTDATVFGCDRINGFCVAVFAWHLTILDGRTQWRQLPKLLVAEFILHSEYVSHQWYVHELELVFGSRFSMLLFDIIFAGSLYDVRTTCELPCDYRRAQTTHHFDWNWLSFLTFKEKKKTAK